jgi:hypothetical protein
MTDCGFCLMGADDGEPSDFYRRVIRTARKPHQCYECFDPIRPGDRYEETTAKWAGQISRNRTCLACVDIADSLSCDGSRLHGGLWEELIDNSYEVGLACLLKLKTVAGKEKLQAFINKRNDV